MPFRAVISAFAYISASEVWPSLVEHWDVIQDEATQEQSTNKAPMFGSSFTNCS
jgi:hypothetical protein